MTRRKEKPPCAAKFEAVDLDGKPAIAFCLAPAGHPKGRHRFGKEIAVTLAPLDDDRAHPAGAEWTAPDPDAEQ